MKKVFFLAALLSANVMVFAAPTSSAPVPSVPANQVMSIFSDTYTPKAAWGFCESWGQTTQLETIKIEEDNILSYTNFNYVGWAAATPYNCLSMEKFHIDIWADEAGKIGVVPIYGGSGLPTDDNQRQIVDLVAGWNSFDFDLATDYAALNLASIFQFKFDQGTISSFAIDNAYFYTTQAPAEDNEAPKDFTAELVSASFFSVKIKASATDNSGSVNYKVISGELVLAGASNKSGEEVIITVASLDPGVEYNFSVVAQDDSGNAAEPIAVVANTVAVPDAAPAPELAAENVVSLYSDAYQTAAPYETLNQSWWQGPVLTEGYLGAEDNVLFYSDFAEGSAFGWAFIENVDASGFPKLHLDIYPSEAVSFTLWPVIDPEADYKLNTAELEANKWNAVELDYTGKTLSPFKQFGWVINKTIDGFFVDNVYFYKETGEGIEDVNATVKAVKTVEDGKLIIIKNGVHFTVTGQIIR